jgi:hypothetical protein
MQHISALQRPAAVVLISLFCISASFADALHKFRKQDAYWHHGSGWIFPRHVAGLELVRSPTQIQGNDDVAAEYTVELNGARRAAVVSVYYPESTDTGAKFITASAAMQASFQTSTCTTSQSEARFGIKQRPEIIGVKATYAPTAGSDCSRLALYFFQAPGWVVTVSATAQATDTGAAEALDTFVRELRWDTLGTDPFLHEAAE